MNTINFDSDSTQLSASSFLLYIIIIVLFLMVFQNQDLSYTSSQRGFTFDEEQTSNISQGSVGKQRRYFLLFLFSVIILKKGKGFSLIIHDSLGRLILANLLWALMSYFWADDPALTGRRLVLLFILNFTALSISINVSLRQLPTIITWISTPILIIGIISEKALGSWWIYSSHYRFRGTMHAEGQAMNCAMLFLAAAHMRDKGGRHARVIFHGLMLFAMIFLLLTKSRGPFLGTVIAFGIHELFTKKRSTLVVYSYLFIVILCIMFLVFGDAIFPLLGSGINLGRREGGSGLMGRVDLWMQLSEFVKERPALGYGLGGFWTQDRILDIADYHEWRIGEGHSIYVDTVLDLGFIGLVTFLTLLIVAWRRALRIQRDGRDEGGAFAASLLTLWAADGLWASAVLGRGFVTLFLMIVLFGIARESHFQHIRKVFANGR